jgi:hypothetical protein
MLGAANLFFRLVSSGHELASLIVTSSLGHHPVACSHGWEKSAAGMLAAGARRKRRHDVSVDWGGAGGMRQLDDPADHGRAGAVAELG